MPAEVSKKLDKSVTIETDVSVFNVLDSSISDTMTAVRDGRITAQAALDQESSGENKGRQSLIRKLVGILEEND